jgi:hypothetical protein
MPITRYENCPSFAPVWNNEKEDTSVELHKDGELEIMVEVINYGCCSSSTEERYVFLSKEEAVEMARFILEQYGEE